MAFLDMFRPRWKHSAREVREAAVSELTDQALLAKIAQNDHDEEVCKAALSKLTDQALLADVAERGSRVLMDCAGGFNLRRAAIMELTDQALLAKIAQNDGVFWMARVKAVEKLTDQALLAKIAQDDGVFWMARLEAVEKVTDKAVLAEVAKNCSSTSVSKAAVEKLAAVMEAHGPANTG